ncbi:MAG: LPS-assembly protein LptD, partial [Candidatus Omnitrophica bacterium]|nr:LPS-assembly protein LptD [Candidatus Omnitrophota bacterium]
MSVKYFHNRNKTLLISTIYVVFLQFTFTALFSLLAVSPAFAQEQEEEQGTEEARVIDPEEVQVAGPEEVQATDTEEVQAIDLEEIQADGPEEVKASDSVELNGDTVEYSVDGNKVTADGDVVVINKKMTLMCDHIEFSLDTVTAYATGNIRLVSTGGEISEMTGEKLTFNFETMSGTFDGAKIFANPYFGYGEKVSKVGENHIQMENNYVTTCDLDKPHYRMTSKKMDMYPG